MCFWSVLFLLVFVDLFPRCANWSVCRWILMTRSCFWKQFWFLWIFFWISLANFDFTWGFASSAGGDVMEKNRNLLKSFRIPVSMEASSLPRRFWVLGKEILNRSRSVFFCSERDQNVYLWQMSQHEPYLDGLLICSGSCTNKIF